MNAVQQPLSTLPCSALSCTGLRALGTGIPPGMPRTRLHLCTSPAAHRNLELCPVKPPGGIGAAPYRFLSPSPLSALGGQIPSAAIR